MNQTKKRLSIIKLAISITDIETIQLQILKLSPIKTDNKIQDILSLLQEGSYAQAQGLITTYIDTVQDEVLQRSSQDKKYIISDEDQSIIDEFDLFVTPTSEETKVIEVDMNDYAHVEPKITKDKHTIDFDSLLNLDADDVLKDNINIDISKTKKVEQDKDNFFKSNNDEKYSSLLDDDPIHKDTFFEDSMENTTQILEEDEPDFLNDDLEVTQVQTKGHDKSSTPKSKDKEIVSDYDAMPHISQKFISMKKRYPLIQKTYEKFDTVESLLTKIAQDGYTEAEIEEMIDYIKKLIEKRQYTEAAQLLLVCAATESKFAQFMLARELYIGSVLTKNIEEAFELMNTLALDNYPEALCDLGQFYENGIGTTANPLKAESLYNEALKLGIKRAKKHHTRLKKLNKGFFKG